MTDNSWAKRLLYPHFASLIPRSQPHTEHWEQCLLLWRTQHLTSVILACPRDVGMQYPNEPVPNPWIQKCIYGCKRN